MMYTLWPARVAVRLTCLVLRLPSVAKETGEEKLFFTRFYNQISV